MAVQDERRGVKRIEAWEQQPGEPDKAFGRFQVYLQLGPTRTLAEAARTAGGRSSGGGYAFGGNWSRYCREWNWRDRAQAWDIRQRDLMAISERNRRVALHHRRVELMEDHLEIVCEVLDRADLPGVDQEQAREWLPQMRMFLRDLLVAERQEFEHFHDDEDYGDGQAITADDLREAVREWEREHGEPYATPNFGNYRPAGAAHTATASDTSADDGNGDAGMRRPYVERAPSRLGRTISVCGRPQRDRPGGGLMLDLDTLRALRAETGLSFHRILDTTRKNFRQHLKREASFGRPVELLHLALPAAEAGVEFSDGLADGQWLRERLAGVRVLLLARYSSDQVPEWAGAVPHVMVLPDKIEEEEGAMVVRKFWHNIGLKMAPQEAWARASEP